MLLETIYFEFLTTILLCYSVVLVASYCQRLHLHFITGQGACFIAKQVVYLSKLLHETATTYKCGLITFNRKD